MRNYTTSSRSPFPKDDIDPKKKLLPEWGLMVAHAIFSHDQMDGPSIFRKNAAEYERLSQYYFGDIDTNQFKPYLNVDSNDPLNDKQNWMKSIDWNIVNYFHKRVNHAIAKISSVEYDPIVDSTNILAINEKHEFDAKLKFMMRYQTLIQQANLSAESFLPNGVAPDDIPRNMGELEVFKMMNSKHYAAMKIEMGIAHHLKRNNYREIKRQYAFDTVMYNVANVSCTMGRDFMPTIKRSNPFTAITAYSNKPDFRDIPYKATLDQWTMNDIAAHFPEVANDPRLYEKIAENYSQAGSNYGYYQDSYFVNKDYFRQHDVNRVLLMHFKYISTNQDTYVEQPDQFGNKILRKKKYGSNRTKAQQENFKKRYGNTRQVKRKTYRSVYEGYWVVGSDILLGYGQRINCINPKKTEPRLNEDLLGEKIYSPNHHNGKSLSMASLAEPLLIKIHQTHLKIDHLIATERPNILKLNLEELRAANLQNRMGEQMSDMEKIDFMIQEGFLIGDTAGRDVRGATAGAYEIKQSNAEKVIHYINVLNQYLAKLDEITGYNPVSLGQALHPEQGKKVAELQVEATNMSLEHFFNADLEISKAVYRQVGMLHRLGEKHGPKGLYEHMYGEPANYGGANLDNYEYSWDVQARPTKEEWREFYEMVKQKNTAGLIGSEDMAVLYELKNIKQARIYLGVAEKRKQDQIQANEMQKINANNEGAQQAALVAQEKEQENIAFKADVDKEMKQMDIAHDKTKHDYKLAEIREKARTEGTWNIAEEKVKGNLANEKEGIKGGLDISKKIIETEEKELTSTTN